MKPTVEFGTRKCLEITGDAICEQYQCNNPATCLTRVSGFKVYACKEHHPCEKDGKEKDRMKYIESLNIRGKKVKGFKDEFEPGDMED